MIKRIIFDLDDTLIIWKDDYLKAIKETVDEYKIKDDYKYINFLIDEYDNIFKRYDALQLINYVNKKINDKIDINFLNTFLLKFGNMSDISESTINVLKYLSQKYELVVLTNWFSKPQYERLKHANIDKYFLNVYGGEKYIKPSYEAFINACGDKKPNECLMIGDNYEKDIKGAYKAGLNVIFFNPKNKDNKDNFIEIKDLRELERMM